MQQIRPDARKEYLKQKVMSASSAELIVMLFEACIKNMKLAQIHLGKKDLSQTHECLTKAQTIIHELINCLDMNYELSNNLLMLYEFLSNSMAEMNVNKDLTGMPDVLEVLESCKDTWQTVAQSQRAKLAGDSYG